ncbi:undecaprenyl-diphosphate phosphatase [Clostridium manihotivorum]|uniref:Undecaprenyl-diphosphatase n=1 Tax=Clostridium manihotivorum TaxID=2320868 RepID=A0A410DTD6_9CLOT|nr:undecaprenyl-diphosphate phosphatase [Clostridium manihotivorum]QAA32513.1 undecaprenyl-diphosphatase [Clostridium manihotivorum]
MNLDFIYILKAIIVAIVEGITEFLPVSSTGHMVFVGELIGFGGTDFTKMFEVVIQLGAILAVVVLYWKKLWKNLIDLFSLNKKAINFWVVILIATIPFGTFGLKFNKFIENNFFTTKTVIVGFIVGGVLLLIAESYRNKKQANFKKDVSDISYIQAIVIGIFQCLALWQGMSRSASTIIGGWVSGIATPVAAELSFFLAIPVMVGASGLELFKFNYSAITTTELVALLIGFIVAFLVALVVVEKFIAYLQKKPMKAFSVYRIVLGVALAIKIFVF